MCYEYHKESNMISVFTNQLIALQSGSIVAFPLICQCLDSFPMLLFLRGEICEPTKILLWNLKCLQMVKLLQLLSVAYREKSLKRVKWKTVKQF